MVIIILLAAPLALLIINVIAAKIVIEKHFKLQAFQFWSMVALSGFWSPLG
jgi:hypothetical protein